MPDTPTTRAVRAHIRRLDEEAREELTPPNPDANKDLERLRKTDPELAAELERLAIERAVSKAWDRSVERENKRNEREHSRKTWRRRMRKGKRRR